MILLLSVVLSLLIACTKQAQFISTISPSENPYVLQVDSFSGNFVVFREDSFVTSNDTFALVGHHIDSLFGRTSCEHFTRFELPGLGDIPNSAQFDSIELILLTDHRSYGDSSGLMKFSVQRLSASISNETNKFYNTTEFATYPRELGYRQTVLRPNLNDSLSILMDKDFGLELFSLFKAKATEVTSSERFQEYFKGLRIYADSGQTSQVVSFKKSLVLRLHYHEDVGNTIAKTIDLQSSTSNYQYNRIRRNFSGSALAALQSAKEINAADLGNRFFLQELLRIRTRINFPNISEILKTSDYVKILNAQLEIKPVAGSWAMYPLPTEMNVYLRKADQTLSSALLNTEGSAQNGNLSLDNLYGQQTNYVFDVTDYLATEMTATSYTTQQLVLVPSGNQSLMSRLAGNTTGSSNLRSRLIVSILVYNNQ
ncbi:DUF4270 family protein [Flavihumibacter fluvii]|uniref:DUF4270 family protein n=1 Tax=Flavihumibacter fluvii TaxID=2838157 RepID=UPI001BDF5E04|nr:DUF4270 family protein [Flavihumibacter fluvii]ULQ54575.1 DUF4270 domain-containing protein [Flavihumibacter fluvii]